MLEQITGDSFLSCLCASEAMNATLRVADYNVDVIRHNFSSSAKAKSAFSMTDSSPNNAGASASKEYYVSFLCLLFYLLNKI